MLPWRTGRALRPLLPGCGSGDGLCGRWSSGAAACHGTLLGGRCLLRQVVIHYSESPFGVHGQRILEAKGHLRPFRALCVATPRGRTLLLCPCGSSWPLRWRRSAGNNEKLPGSNGHLPSGGAPPSTRRLHLLHRSQCFCHAVGATRDAVKGQAFLPQERPPVDRIHELPRPHQVLRQRVRIEAVPWTLSPGRCSATGATRACCSASSATACTELEGSFAEHADRS
mmetsp:Transcript_40419/g.101526  ORF Transcript_40419/g.101526 Transcript_40419/m.101526 type:complete len:226 (+) Transcript_40419:1039-1716(+)